MSIVSLLLALCLVLPQEENLRDLSGMSEEDAVAIVDGTPLDPSNKQFKKLLYRTGTVDPSVLRQWAKRSKDVSQEQLASAPEQFRFHPFSMDAKVNSIHRFAYSKEDARDFLSGFYFADCQTHNGTKFALVSRSSVASWPLNQELPKPQSIQFDSFYLGNQSIELSEGNAIASRPVFIARRFAWRPDEESAELKVDATKVALAKSGVDISLLDIVKSRKGKSIGNRESVCYWQMLAACKNAPTKSSPPIGFTAMLQKPIESVGKAASVQGRVRQCVPIKVTSSEAAELLGTDTCYQLTIFPNLSGRPIQVATREGEPEVYSNAFPVTVCTLNLPPGLDSETVVGKTYQFSGFFYRIWSYPSERTENSGLDNQPSPLMMAHTLTNVKSTSGQLQTLLAAILLAMAIAVGFVIWFVFRSKKSETRSELPDQIEAW